MTSLYYKAYIKSINRQCDNFSPSSPRRHLNGTCRAAAAGGGSAVAAALPTSRASITSCSELRTSLCTFCSQLYHNKHSNSNTFLIRMPAHPTFYIIRWQTNNRPRDLTEIVKQLLPIDIPNYSYVVSPQSTEE